MRGIDLRPKLTRREAEVLAVLCVFGRDETLDYERGRAYFGAVSISARLVMSLLRKCVISPCLSSGVERYRINETGRVALADHWGVDSLGECSG